MRGECLRGFPPLPRSLEEGGGWEGGSSSTPGETHRGKAPFEACAGVISVNEQGEGGKEKKTKPNPKGSLSCYPWPVPWGSAGQCRRAGVVGVPTAFGVPKAVPKAFPCPQVKGSQTMNIISAIFALLGIVAFIVDLNLNGLYRSSFNYYNYLVLVSGGTAGVSPPSLCFRSSGAQGWLNLPGQG